MWYGQPSFLRRCGLVGSLQSGSADRRALVLRDPNRAGRCTQGRSSGQRQHTLGEDFHSSGRTGGPPIAYSAETDDAGLLEISIEDTDLPAGEYVADRIDLDGDIAPQFTQYVASHSDTPFVLSDFPAAELQRSCVTDITPPTFTVATESASAP